jgi:hypothetical protein
VRRAKFGEDEPVLQLAAGATANATPGRINLIVTSNYGVETHSLNQAVKRNFKRFSIDFLLRLSEEEATKIRALRSQFVILKAGRGQHRKFFANSIPCHVRRKSARP